MRERAPTPHTSAHCLPCCLGSECETGSRPGASPDSHCRPHASPLPQNAIPALLALSTYAALTSQARPGFNVRLTDRHGSNQRKLAILVSWLGRYTEPNRLSRRNGMASCLDGDCSRNRVWLVPENVVRNDRFCPVCQAKQTVSSCSDAVGSTHGSMRMVERERERPKGEAASGAEAPETATLQILTRCCQLSGFRKLEARLAASAFVTSLPSQSGACHQLDQSLRALHPTC
ncbi:hypothetical protein L1887_59804 [Cichorium endivia]|nr:hypothetical protein L1887_59804 [Cichorium endivia]